MCAYYCVGILTYMCISRGQRSTRGVFLYFCLPELWRHGFSLNSGFTISVERLTREPTGSPISACTVQVCATVPSFYVIAGDPRPSGTLATKPSLQPGFF